MPKYLFKLTYEEKEDIFERFYESGLHSRNNGGSRKKWCPKAYCVLQINNYLPEVVESTRYAHAEKLMLNRLEEFMNHEGVVNVYMNYSPCCACSSRLFHLFCNPAWKLELAIYFVQLWRVNRKSCEFDSTCSCRGDQDNEDGLRQLKESGRLQSFQSFTYTQWEDLASLLQVDNTADCKRGREDAEIASDFEHILNISRD